MSTPADNKDRVCDYYLSFKGCIKGDECDHLHPVAPNGAKVNRICDFYSTPKGCSKGNDCGFLHVKRYNPLGEPCARVCDFFLTEQGCIKGMQCNFAHPRAIPAEKARQVFAGQGGKRSGSGANSSAFSSEKTFGNVTLKGSAVTIDGERVCEFYLTPTGCNKSSECKYLHPRGKDAQDALKAKEWANKNKTNVAGGASRPRGARISGLNSGRRGASNGEKKDKVCQFFKTEAGCKKGNDCDYKHE